MVNVKVNRKALVRAAKEDKPEKTNYTFRLSKDLYELFQKICENDKVKPTAVIEAFLKDFTRQ